MSIAAQEYLVAATANLYWYLWYMLREGGGSKGQRGGGRAKEWARDLERERPEGRERRVSDEEWEQKPKSIFLYPGTVFCSFPLQLRIHNGGPCVQSRADAAVLYGIRDNCVWLAVSGSQLRNIKPELSAASYWDSNYFQKISTINSPVSLNWFSCT